MKKIAKSIRSLVNSLADALRRWNTEPDDCITVMICNEII